MRLPPSLSLAFKLPLVLTLMVSVVAATIGAAMFNRDRERLSDQLRAKASLLVRALAVTIRDPILRSDSWTLYKILRQITQHENKTLGSAIVTAMILDSGGNVLAHLYPALFPIGLPLLRENSPELPRLQAELRMTEPGIIAGAGFIEAVAPVRAGGKNIGLARIQLSTSELDRESNEVGAAILIFCVLIAMIGITIGGIWSNRTLQPLQTLAQSMDELGRGVVRPLSISRGDEIGQLVQSFNQMTRELDEKRKLEHELAANEKIIALGRIAAGVAHEVNNPLAGMLNCLSTLHAKSNDPELVARYLPLIGKGLHKIDALVKDLLAEFRIGDANEVADASNLEDVRELIAAEIDPSRIEFHWENRLPADEKISRARIEQVLLNLLRNAIQAMPNGGCLWCRCWRANDDIVFEVEDTGQGIPSNDIKRIFDPFFTSRPAGTGLGLWIVFRLVQSMRGTIDVNSEPDKGTKFQVRIPRESPDVSQPT